MPNTKLIRRVSEIGSLSHVKKVRLYVAEEQQILREAYQSVFQGHAYIEIVGASGETDGESLVGAASALRPDTILLGIKVLQPVVVERLEMVRERCPDVAIVLLSAYYDVKGLKALREFSRGASVGCAYLLKHTIDTVEQLTQVIYSVAEGRIILDPAVMEARFVSSSVELIFGQTSFSPPHTLTCATCLEARNSGAGGLVRPQQRMTYIRLDFSHRSVHAVHPQWPLGRDRGRSVHTYPPLGHHPKGLPSG